MSSGITPLNPEQTKKQEQKADSEGYIHRVLVGADQETNILTGGLPDETISSRAARAAQHGSRTGRVLSRFLDLFQRNHGAKAVAADEQRAKEAEQVEDSSGILSE